MSWPRTTHYSLILPQADTIGGSGPVVGEIPAGALDGVNLVYTLAHFPATGTLNLFVSGSLVHEGVDYTIAGRTVTFVAGPTDLRANYSAIGEYGSILELICGPQIEKLGRNGSSLILSPAGPMPAGSIVKLTSGDVVDADAWATGQLVTVNDGARGAPVRALLAGVIALATNGTAGHFVVPSASDSSGDLDATAEDDSVRSTLVWRRPLGFSLGGAILVGGPLPLAQLKNMQVGMFVAGGGSNPTYQGGFSGGVSGGATVEVAWEVLVPADFDGFHEGVGEAAIAAQIGVTITGTVTASARLVDTAGAATAYGTAGTTKATVAATVANGGTFTPGRIAFFTLKMSGGVSGGNFTCDRYPAIRYQPLMRSNV